MGEITTGAQFAAGCLALGLGIFLITNAIHGVLHAQPFSAVAASTISALGGLLLLAAGLYAAGLAVPL